MSATGGGGGRGWGAGWGSGLGGDPEVWVEEEGGRSWRSGAWPVAGDLGGGGRYEMNMWEGHTER